MQEIDGQEEFIMMYPFLILDDSTEIVHSEMQPDSTVKVYIEKPDEKDCFHHATCILPGYEWKDVFGFSKADLERYEVLIRSHIHTIGE